MPAIEVVIHGTASGTCPLSGKEGEGLTVTFMDGTISEGFLSFKSFLSLVKMKFARQNGKAEEPKGKEAKPDAKAPPPPSAIPMTAKVS